MSEAQKQAMREGRERKRRLRAQADQVEPKQRRKSRAAKAAPEAAPIGWTFNIDEAGALAIIDKADGAGIELTPERTVQLLVFLLRVLPPPQARTTRHSEFVEQLLQTVPSLREVAA